MTSSKTGSKVGRNFQKLIIKFTNAPVLDEVLFLQKTLIESIAKMQKSILESSRAVMRWGQTETNFTFTDVLSNWFDLDNALWLLLQDLQSECVRYRQVYKGIKEEERIMCELGRKKEAKVNEVNRLKSKVAALKKAGTKKVERLDTIEAELMLAEQEEKKLDEELNTFVAEFEKSKARIIKDALEVYSKGWVTFARTSLDIFNAQSQIAEDMPSKPTMFQDQITDSNQMLVSKTFQKLKLQKPDRDFKPEREIKPENNSPHFRKASVDNIQAAVDDQPKQSIFGSLGNNLGAKLSKFKTSKECLAEEPVNAGRSSSLARPLPEVPPDDGDEEEADDDDEYSMLNNDNLDDENYVVPTLPSPNAEGTRQYTFLKQDMDQPRFPPGMTRPMNLPTRLPPAPHIDQPRYPPGYSRNLEERKLSPGMSRPSTDSTEGDPFEDDPYLAVISDASEEDNSNEVYEDLHPAQPPPRPPKNNSDLSVPAAYASPNAFGVALKKTSPKPGRKQASLDSPDFHEPEKGTLPFKPPKLSPRPKRTPPKHPPPTLPTTLPPTLPPKAGVSH